MSPMERRWSSRSRSHPVHSDELAGSAGIDGTGLESLETETMTLPLTNEHEIGFVTTFIIRERRERYLMLLGNPKRRGKALKRLNHAQDIDFSLTRPVPSGCVAESLAVLLENLGASETCYVIADASDMDGQTLPLREALWRASVHGFAVVLSCLPGRLCFYKPESPTPGFILEKRRAETAQGTFSRGWLVT